ncbi:MAG: hypothetical protein C4290_11110, partial [Chloroflexota bacterium]
ASSRPAYAEALRAAERTGRALPPPLLRLWSALAHHADAADRYVSGELHHPEDVLAAVQGIAPGDASS